MAKIPEVTIASFWNLSNDELPDHALSGRVIIVDETKDMYVGTGLETPILKISDLQVVETIDDLYEKDNTLSILYIVSSTNELYFFYKQVLLKCNGLGIIGVYDKYVDLPTSNSIEGIFCVKHDETNQMYSTLYIYSTTAGYIRLHYSNFDYNYFYQFKVNDMYLAAKGANSILNINTDNTIQTTISDNKIFIEQKSSSTNILKREQYDLFSGLLEQFPGGSASLINMAIVKDELYVLGYSTSGNADFVNSLYKYNKINGWVLLRSNQIPYAAVRCAIFTYNNKIYICGGFNIGGYSGINTLYEFDPETLVFTQKASMNAARGGFCYGIIDNKLWVIGGKRVSNYSDTLSNMEYYDFESDSWTLMPKEYQTPMYFYQGISFVIDREIHLVTYRHHYVFNVDTLTYKYKTSTPFDVANAGCVTTTYDIVYCVKSGILYSYNSKINIWTTHGPLLYNKTSPYLCIDDNDMIYNLGDIAQNSNAVKLETIQILRKDITNDCQITIRMPLNKKIVYNGDIYRSLTIPEGGYIEYPCYGGNETLDIIIQDFKY